MKNKESKAIKILRKEGENMIKNQLLSHIFRPGIDTYNRFYHFLEVAPQLKGWQYWYLLREAYKSSDGLFIHRHEIKACFMRNEPEKVSLMSIYERRFQKSLKSKITIYRGMSKSEAESRDFGVSWTLSQKMAEFFAFKYHRAPFPPDEMTVMTLEVDSSDVIAYFSGREREIIYIQNVNI